MNKAVSTSGLWLVTAGAGTGKTTFLTNQFIEKFEFLLKEGLSPVDAAGKILAVTFTVKAAEEMKNRVALKISPELLPYLKISTIDALCSSILKEFAGEAHIESDFTMISDGYEKIFLKNVIKKLSNNVDITLDPDDFYKKEKEIYALFDEFRRNLASVESLKVTDNFSQFIKILYSAFEEELKEKKVLDFSHLLYLSHKLVKEKEEVRKKLSKRWRFVFIDEFQDTSRAQIEFFKTINPEFLLVVGDYNQSIYSFRGAEPDALVEVSNKAEKIILARNYRTTNRRIINFANAFADELTDFTNLEAREDSFDGEPVKIVSASTHRQEAEFIADEIIELKKKGYSFSDFAVVLRAASTWIGIYEDVFRFRKIPFLSTSASHFFDRCEIRQIISIVKAVILPTDNEAFVELLLSPMFRFSLDNVYKLRGDCLYEAFLKTDFGDENPKKELILSIFEHARAKRLRCLGEFLLAIVESSQIMEWIEKSFEESSRERGKANIKAFLERASQFEQEAENPTVADFLEYINIVTEEEVAAPDAQVFSSEKGLVEFFTVHRIKGLERKVIFLANVRHLQFPPRERRSSPWKISFEKNSCVIEKAPKKSSSKKPSPEEWRLFYVGITRAIERLYILGSAHKKMLEKGEPQKSIFDHILAKKEKLKDFSVFIDYGGEENLPQTSDKFLVFTPLRRDKKSGKPLEVGNIIKEKINLGFTVSEIEEYLASPKKFFEKFILKVPQKENTSAINEGNVFHHLIYLYDKIEKSSFKRMVFESLNSPDKEKIFRMIQNFVSSPLSKPAFMKEVPFMVKVGPSFLKGAIDRVEKEKDGFVIYDYKTGGDGNVSDFVFSMNAYAFGLNTLTGFPVKALRIFFLNCGKIKDVPLWDTTETRHKVEKAINGIIEGRF